MSFAFEHTPGGAANGRIYVQARALEAFCGYTYAGALYILRERPDAIEFGIQRAAREGIDGLENYLASLGRA